jgi:hypothetical protein
MSGRQSGFATPGQGWWGLPLNADDQHPEDRCEPSLRQQIYRMIDAAKAQGIEHDPAIRWVEDQLGFKRGALVPFLER